MAKFRNKPRIVEAEQFWPDKPLPHRKLGPVVSLDVDGDVDRYYVITAHLQRAYLHAGDWVVLEPYPRLAAYPVKPDIFAATYEPAGAAQEEPAP